MLPAALYVHVPFCARRCVYCDFSIAVRRDVPVDDYVRGLRAELALRARAWNGRPTLDTVYLGGGTPSRLGGDGIRRVLDAVREVATIAARAEITVEANPEDVDERSLAAWRGAGANRLSLGAQSFHGPSLEWMHRVHDAGRAETAVAAARAAGFDNISLDLIFALPDALGRSWRDDVCRAVDLEPEHLSVYGLTVEPATPLGRWRGRGELQEASEEQYEEEFLEADVLLTGAGYGHYEVSSYARPDRESRHNSAYWRDLPYEGVGPSAHAYDGRVRRWNVRPYADWLARLDAGADPGGGAETLTSENRLNEQVYLGLRTAGGLALVDSDLPHARAWEAAGWAVIADGQLRVTPLGWLRLDTLAEVLTVSRSH